MGIGQCSDEYMSKSDIHMFICEELNRTYIAKNGDYGDSFAYVRGIYPNSIMVRIFDKVLRLQKLLEQGYTPQVQESVDDTLLDLANYAIMELVERQHDEEKQNIEIQRVLEEEYRQSLLQASRT